MVKNIVILLLRVALGIGFLSAVADRFGFWGNHGAPAVAWGDWENFISYTSTLNFNVSLEVANWLEIIAFVL